MFTENRFACSSFVKSLSIRNRENLVTEANLHKHPYLLVLCTQERSTRSMDNDVAIKVKKRTLRFAFMRCTIVQTNFSIGVIHVDSVQLYRWFESLTSGALL